MLIKQAQWKAMLIAVADRSQQQAGYLSEIDSRFGDGDHGVTMSHVAYQVDNADPYLEHADQVIFGPVDGGPGVRMAFIIQDGAIIELYEKKE